MKSGSLKKMFSGSSIPDTPYSWVVTFAGFVVYAICIGCYMGTTGVFFSSFLNEFNANHSVTAVVSALTSVIYLGCGVVAGYLTNRWGCRPVVMLGAICMGLSFVGTSFSRSINLIYLTQGFLKGLATILMLQPLFVIVSDYHLKRRALAMSIVSCGAGAGTAIFSSLAAWLIRSVGWRWACRVLGSVFCVVGTLAAMTFVPIDLNHPDSPKRFPPLKYSELLNVQACRYLYLSLFFYGCYITVYTTFLTNFAETKNISSAQAAGLWTYWGIASVAGRLYGGIWKSTPLIRLRDFSLAVLEMGVVSWILAFRFKGYPNYWAFVISQITNGWLMGILYHLSSLCMADVLGVENVSLAMGLFFTVQTPLGVAGPPLFGWITDEADGNYSQTFQILAMVQTLSGLLMLLFWKHGRVMILKRAEASGSVEEDEHKKICGGLDTADDDSDTSNTPIIYLAAGIVNDTFIIFAGDHGSPPDDPHYLNYSRDYPFNNGKGTIWEGGVRCPAFIWHQHLESKVITTPTSVVDFLPTIASLAGLSSCDIEWDGIDLTPYFGEDDSSNDDRMLLIDCDIGCSMDYEESPRAGIRYRNFKLMSRCVTVNESGEAISSNITYFFHVVNDVNESYNYVDYTEPSSADFPYYAEYWLMMEALKAYALEAQYQYPQNMQEIWCENCTDECGTDEVDGLFGLRPWMWCSDDEQGWECRSYCRDFGDPMPFADNLRSENLCNLLEISGGGLGMIFIYVATSFFAVTIVALSIYLCATYKRRVLFYRLEELNAEEEQGNVR